MIQKRIKSGLAVTERHLTMMDENLGRAKAGSRNDFVEQAVEFYAGHLSSGEHAGYIGDLISSELDKRFYRFAKTFSTNQYKLSVQVAVLCHLIAAQYDYDQRQVDQLIQFCAGEVKRMDSVPDFGEILRAQREERT